MKSLKTPRILSIDSFRVISAFAIIVIHTCPFYPLGELNPRFKMLAYMILSTCRFAVPFFFLSAGYFYGRSLLKNPHPVAVLGKQLKRLSVLFLLWTLIYALLPAQIAASDWQTLLLSGPKEALVKFQTSPLNFIFEGTSLPLWFLTALIFAYLILTLFLVTKKEKYLLPVAIGLYLFGVLNSLYSVTPAGIRLPFEFHFRNGPFFSTLFVVFGWKLCNLKKPPVSVKTALTLLAAGFLIQEAEALIICSHYGVSPIFDYLIGTIPFSLGFFLLALAKPDLGKNSMLPNFAPWALGIYLTHPYIKMLLKPWAAYFNPFLWQALFPCLVFMLCSVLVYGLSKHPAFRFLFQMENAKEKTRADGTKGIVLDLVSEEEGEVTKTA